MNGVYNLFYTSTKSVGVRIVKPMEEAQALETIWEMPDDLWGKVESVILKGDHPKSTGRKRVNPRPILNGIIFCLRSGCQWNHLPKTFGDDSTIHRTFQRWVESGVLSQVWSVMVEESEELGGVDWEWQSADCALGKARLGGGARLAPTPRTEARRAANEAC